MITTCTTCGTLYDAGSEEQANEPTRYCHGCWAKRKTECKHSLDVSPSGQMATCALCGFVGRWRDGAWEKVEERAPVTPASAAPHTPAAPDMLQMLRDIDEHFAAHFGEQAWATSEIGGMTRVTIAKAEGGAA